MVAGADLTTKNVNFGTFPVKQQVEDEVQTYNVIAILMTFWLHLFLLYFTAYSSFKILLQIFAIIFVVIYKVKKDNKSQIFLVLAMLSVTTSVWSLVMYGIYT